jgi:hypothetical protein
MPEQDLNKLLEKLTPHIQEVIRATVNGKIDAQRQEMQTFLTSFYEASRNQVGAMRSLEQKFDDYIEDDNAWKETAEPIIEMGKDARGAGRIFMLAVGTIIAVGGAWQIIVSLFKNK